MNDIKDMIFEIRGMQVMLDVDVAKLYNYATKRILETRKRNLSRFPENFCFQLTIEEYKLLKRNTNFKYSRSQFVTLNEKNNKWSQFATTSEKLENKIDSNDLRSQIATSSLNNDIMRSHFVTASEKPESKIDSSVSRSQIATLNKEDCMWSQNVTTSEKLENKVDSSDLRSQFVTSSLEIKNADLLNDMMRSHFATALKHGGNRYLPYVFTEQGIAMLSGLLKNKIAIQVSINIMNAFVEMRKFIMNNAHIFERLTNVEYKLLEHDNKFDKLFNELQKDDNFKQKIFYEGQIYDAYSLIIDLIKSSNKEIILIDNYIDNRVLDMLSKKNDNVNVLLITNHSRNIISLDIDKFNKQYPTISIEYSTNFHDRFLIIDGEDIYHIGASLKDLGKKCFAISKIKDINFIAKVFDDCLIMDK